jgi:glycosyltransferase involved in cell wall biosynthesis
MSVSELSRHSIVYFGNDWRAENRTSSHHIAARLAKRTRVLYVSTPGARPPQASGRDVARLFKKLGEAFRLPQQVDEQLWVMTMPQAPFRSLPLVEQINHAAGRMMLGRAIRHLGFDHLISWFLVPHPGSFARQLGEELSVYYCVDDYAAFPGADRAAIQHYDRTLTAGSDCVFFTSQRLCEQRRAERPDGIYSPHGVDFDLFHQALDPALNVAEPLRDLRKPVIGWFGLIAAWVDIALITAMARARPEWSFVLVGLPSVDVSELRALPNVLFPGPRPYQTLPQWAKGFDVCIAPYLLNQQLMNANPLKIREYLATGRPVVSMWAPEIEPYAHVARVVRDRDQFLGAIEAALAEGPQAHLDDRLNAVRDSTWDARVETIAGHVERALAARKGR